MAGKAALQASRFDAFWIEPEKLTLVLDKKSPFYQSRAEEPPDESLVLSMLANKFLPHQAISVFKDGDKLCVLDGRRRKIAACEANRRLRAKHLEPIKVSVILKKGTEADLYAVQCAANESREDVSDVVRAEELSKLMSYGKTIEEAGAVIGLDKNHATRILAILDCDTKVQKAVEQGKLPATGAWRLSKFDRAEQVKQLDKMIEEAGGKKIKVRRVMKAVRAAKGASTVERPSLKELKAVLVRAENDETAGDLVDVLRWVVTGEAHGDFGDWMHAAPNSKPVVAPVAPIGETTVAAPDLTSPDFDDEISADEARAAPAVQLTPPEPNKVTPLPGEKIAPADDLPALPGTGMSA